MLIPFVNMNLWNKQKELGDKNSAAIDQIRQLLPLPKQPYEVITVEPYGAVLDNKGNRVQGFDAIGKKPVSETELSASDILCCLVWWLRNHYFFSVVSSSYSWQCTVF